MLEILNSLHFTTPTPIQLKSLPVTIAGKDIVGIAQTGTGKTLAFGIPLIQRLAADKGRGLVILPTRELALQVDESLRTIGSKLGLRTAVLIGGEYIGRQLNALKRNPHIIIATPGRLNDHIKSYKLRLDDVKIVVLDEADMMFSLGFAPQIELILKSVPKARQTMLFSATMPAAILKLVNAHMNLPVSIEVAPTGSTAENVTQEMVILRNDDKYPELLSIAKEYAGTILVFLRTKHNVKKICLRLNEDGYRAVEIHSNRSLSQRKEALAGFKNGRYRIMVATDVAARGIDVKEIELVVNYDLPENSEDYVHRIGRTGRAGKFGKAISFALPNQSRDIRDIERLIKQNIKVTKQLAKPGDIDQPKEPRRSGQISRSRKSIGGRMVHSERSNERYSSQTSSNKHQNQNKPTTDWKNKKTSGSPYPTKRQDFGGVSRFRSQSETPRSGNNYTSHSVQSSKDNLFSDGLNYIEGKKSFGARKPFNARKNAGVKKPFSTKKSFSDHPTTSDNKRAPRSGGNKYRGNNDRDNSSPIKFSDDQRYRISTRRSKF